MTESRQSAEGAPPLAGVKVLDLSRVLAAPFATMLLADLGAEVLKVESPRGGDQTRKWGTPLAGGETTYYLAVNRSKQSIAIDFSKAEGAALVSELAAGSDVVIENYMLGALDRYGLGPEALQKANPRLIYCSLSGYGRTGPSAHRPGYDSVIQAESGLISINGDPDLPPFKIGVSISDITGGMYATQAILAALIARERSGRGDYIDLALLDCSMANLAAVASNALLLNMIPKRWGNSHADILPQGMFATRDGDIMFHVGTDEQFHRFCEYVLDAPQLSDDPRFLSNAVRRQHREALDGLIAERLASRSRREWLPLFEKAGVPAGEVRNVLEALTSEEASARNMVRELDHPTEGRIRVTANPIRMSHSALVEPKAPPLLGQHTDEILRERLGLKTERIAELRSLQVVA